MYWLLAVLVLIAVAFVSPLAVLVFAVLGGVFVTVKEMRAPAAKDENPPEDPSVVAALQQQMQKLTQRMGELERQLARLSTHAVPRASPAEEAVAENTVLPAAAPSSLEPVSAPILTVPRADESAASVVPRVAEPVLRLPVSPTSAAPTATSSPSSPGASTPAPVPISAPAARPNPSPVAPVAPEPSLIERLPAPRA